MQPKLNFRCKYCNARLKVSLSKSGERLPCPNCGCDVDIPLLEAATPQDLNLTVPPLPFSQAHSNQPEREDATKAAFGGRQTLRHAIMKWTTAKPVVIVLATAATFVVLLRVDFTSRPSIAVPTTTVASLTDASRRLELRGYLHQKHSNSYGFDSSEYMKTTDDAAHEVSIGRWSGDPRLRELFIMIRTDTTSFADIESRQRIWNTLESDVYAMISDKEDFQRAVNSMVGDTDSGTTIASGHATTKDGWTIEVSEYGSYSRMFEGTKSNKIPVFLVLLRNVAVEEDMPASAEAEYNRQMSDAMEQGRKVREESMDLSP